MKNIEKSSLEDDSSSFGTLPDDIVLQIFRKLIDLETLFPCKLVSKRFYQIILQVDTISFIAKHDILLKSIVPVIRSLRSFARLKSLSIQFPSSPYDYPPFFNALSLLFKWKIKFGSTINSLVCLLPNSVYHNKESYDNANGQEQEHGQEEDNARLNRDKQWCASSCLKIALKRHYMMLICIGNIPLLENVSIMESKKRGRVFVSGPKVAEIRNNVTLPSNLIEYTIRFECRLSKWYVLLLELPDSGFVMKGATLILMQRKDLPNDDDSFMKSNDYVDDDFEHKKESHIVKLYWRFSRNNKWVDVVNLHWGLPLITCSESTLGIAFN